MARRPSAVRWRSVIPAVAMVVGLGLLAGRSLAEPTPAGRLQIRNDSGNAWFLWMYPEHGKQWRKPQFLPRRQAVPVDLQGEGRFYLALRDESDRAIHVGWRDLRAAAEKLAVPPDGVAELSLTTAIVEETREQTYMVSVPRTETVIRIVEENGVKREVESTVTVMVPEHRTRTVSVTTEQVVLRGTAAGRPFTLDAEPALDLPEPPPLPGEPAADRPAPSDE